MERGYARGARGQDDVWRERDQFLSELVNRIGIARAIAILDPHVSTDDPT
jgi:hypothetical protein